VTKIIWKCSEVKWGELEWIEVKWCDMNLSGFKPNDRIVKCSWAKWSVVRILVTGCLTLLEDI
jgi:hypothetical protein